MSKSTDLLVVNPQLSYFRFAQRVTPAQVAQAKIDLAHFFNDLQFVPYTQATQRKLNAQRVAFFTNPNYLVQL